MKRQVNCFVNEPGAGAGYMHYYDSCPKRVRKLLANANYNLCMACFGRIKTIREAKPQIAAMENKIRNR